ncbi:helicase associated domain-containing protein [Streptomyces mirabilis]|uniref:helicase associated domain-containing protein n=1 Tax=Streptomyces mirabilis TaxID=68239 RepID=UPI0036D92165
MDVGRWLRKQRQHATWQGLMDGQRERLEQLGIAPLAPEPEAPAQRSTAPVAAFERSVAAGRSTRRARAP